LREEILRQHFFKKQTIHDLFEEKAIATNDDLQEENDNGTGKKSVGAFETALATAEDDTDRQATKVARAEENQDEQDFNEQTEEEQFQAVLAELSKVEIYALHLLELRENDWVQGQLDAAQAEIEARKEEFDAEKLEELTQEIRHEIGDESTDDEADIEDEDEYAPGESDSDDEDTIAKEEKEVDEKNNGNEINMLENDAEVPLEELIKLYYPDQYKEMDLEVQELPEGLELDEGGQIVSSDLYTVVAHVEGSLENGLDHVTDTKGMSVQEQDTSADCNKNDSLIAETLESLDDSNICVEKLDTNSLDTIEVTQLNDIPTDIESSISQNQTEDNVDVSDQNENGVDA